MSMFEVREPSYKLVETRFGDTLRFIAFREMGDANRWRELVFLNRLEHPYLTNDPKEASESVILTGSPIKVPVVEGLNNNRIDADYVYARDVKLDGRQLQASASGDLELCAGVDNLNQQLRHRVITPRGQMVHHPSYGCYIWRLLGGTNGYIAGLLGSDYVKAALEADYRVKSVVRSDAEVIGESLQVKAVAVAIDGTEVGLSVGI